VSAKNKGWVERLSQEGRMEPQGLRAVELARSSGTWDALNNVERLELPEDFAHAFSRLPGSLLTFQSLSRTNQRTVLEWIESAKRPDTRAKRIAETVARAERGEVANLWSAKAKPDAT
jgi:uncharacterized protein YdeI (YjbR/CyaY-like superfamily)